ncbi:MAG: putative metal-binding motif-containing protein [Deltaproteobacteria bacterium]|nr:putative metal-binding motif-containing protein [Deltaproteobacteria bacterium]
MDGGVAVAVSRRLVRGLGPATIAGVVIAAWPAGCSDGGPPDVCESRGPEVCNGVDDDCNGETDDVRVIAPEICNGVDDDCDGATDEGVEPEPEACNGVDDDCDGQTDEDLPLREETCNGIDDDCDGVVDEGVYGVVSGPWLLVADQEQLLSADFPSSVPLPDGRFVVTWATRLEPGTSGEARYVMADPSTEDATVGVLPPYPAEGTVAIYLDGQVEVFVVVGPPNWQPRDGPARLVSVPIALDGTVGGSRELWLDPEPGPPWWRVRPIAATRVGDHVVVGLIRDWEFTEGSAYYDELVLLDIGPDGTLSSVWPDESNRLVDRRATMTVAEDGLFRLMWLDGENAGMIQFGGPAGDPFGGPIYNVIGPAPTPVPGWAVLPSGPSWSSIGSYPSSVFAVRDRIMGIYDLVLDDADHIVGMVAAELRRFGDTFRPWHASFIPSDTVPVVGPGEGQNLVLVGSGTSGPDRPEELRYWHAHDLRAMAASAPTGTIPWDHDAWPAFLRPSRGSADGSRTFVMVYEGGLWLTNTYGMVLGCLP